MLGEILTLWGDIAEWRTTMSGEPVQGPPNVRYFCVSTKYLPAGLAGSGR